ncbi:unnamed protein product [Bubo scandiacus]
MEKTLRLMEEVQVPPPARGRALVLRARALAVSPAGAARAEQALGRAVKLDPALGPAWTRLGEARWRRGTCRGPGPASGALQHGEDAEARRLLSMVLRAGGDPGGVPGGALRESLAQAEAAVRCAPRDGRSWWRWGPTHRRWVWGGGGRCGAGGGRYGGWGGAMGLGGRERVDPEAANNPDLHLNRATYEERFGAALEGLGRGRGLGPGWAEPRRRLERLLEFLSRLCALLANRGKVRGKRRRGLEVPLSPVPAGAAGGRGGAAPVSPPRPAPGGQPAAGAAGTGPLQPQPRGARALRRGAPGPLGGGGRRHHLQRGGRAGGVLVGDALAVPDPHLCHHHLQHQGKTFSFTAIRVPSPLALVVNGRRPPGPALAPARLALLNQPLPPSAPSAPPSAPSAAPSAPSAAPSAPSAAPGPPPPPGGANKGPSGGSL